MNLWKKKTRLTINDTSEKVKNIISRHNNLEKELSSEKIDPKLFAKKSKEYSSLGGIIQLLRNM